MPRFESPLSIFQRNFRSISKKSFNLKIFRYNSTSKCYIILFFCAQKVSVKKFLVKNYLTSKIANYNNISNTDITLFEFFDMF